MVEELKVAVEVEREDNGWISKESLSKAIISVMGEDSEIAGLVKYNHAKLKEELTSEGMQERYLGTFIQNLQGLLDWLSATYELNYLKICTKKSSKGFQLRKDLIVL